MLVLSRKAREQIQIGDEVVVTILQVKGQAVRIGIEAPRNVRVLRSELPKHETLGDGTTNHDKAEPPAVKTTARVSPGTARTEHPGEKNLTTEAPPLAHRIDARRSPQLNSLDPLRHSQRMELTMVRFDSAVRSTLSR